MTLYNQGRTKIKTTTQMDGTKINENQEENEDDNGGVDDRKPSAVNIVSPDRKAQCSSKGREETGNSHSSASKDEGIIDEPTKRKIANPYGVSKKARCATVEEDADDTKGEGRKGKETVPEPGKTLSFLGHQTTRTIFCELCMHEYNKEDVEKYYRCRTFNCGVYVKDAFRDKDKYVNRDRVPNTIEQDMVFEDMTKQFHAIQYSFVHNGGPRKNNVGALWNMKHKAVKANILPDDTFKPRYGSNYMLLNAIRQVDESLRLKDKEAFQKAFYHLMYIIVVGNYHVASP